MGNVGERAGRKKLEFGKEKVKSISGLTGGWCMGEEEP